MATASFGFSSGYIDQTVIKTFFANRFMSTSNLPDESFANSNLGKAFLPSTLSSLPSTQTEATTTTNLVYRGLLSGSYVYSVGTPPINAVNIVIVGNV